LTRDLYAISGKGSFSKDFGLKDQVRRAGVSMMANIAEGFERDGTAEFIQFLAVAKGSAAEVRLMPTLRSINATLLKKSFPA
jgi:four helix bundle protein